MSQFSYIDIFAGCGGLSLGLHNAGWKGLFAIEKSKDAFETLKYNLKKLMNKMETYVTLNILQIICWMKIRLPDEFFSRKYNRSMTYFKGTTRFR